MAREKRQEVSPEEFTALWLAGTPTRLIAEKLKITADRCDATRRGLGLPPRESWHNSKAGRRRAYIPGPEEIRQKCLTFQAGWSEEERAKRRVGWRPPDPVEVRSFPDAVFDPGADATSFLEGLIDSSG